MRKYTKPIVLVLIAAILGGVYFFANSRQSKTPDAVTQESGSIKFFEVDSQKVSEVTVEKDSDKVVYQKKDKDFVVSYPADLKADSSKVNSVITNVCNLFVEKVVEENATDTAKYGFNKPVKVTVKYEGGTEEFEIGDLNSTKDSYYIREKGNNKIYTVGTYTIQSIDVSKNDLRDKTLFSAKAEDITGLSFKKGGDLVFTSKKTGDQQWTLTAPIDANADATSMATITNAIAQLTTYTSFVEDKPADLDKYGLKNPLYSLTFETGSGKKTLLLGNDKTKGSETYAMVEGTQQVITIDPSALTFLDKPLKEIIEVFAYIVNIQDVSKVVVDMDGKSIVSDIETNKDDSSKDKFTVDGKDANITDDKDNNLFKKYYQSVIGVTMSEIDTNYKPQGKAEITFTYTLKKDPGTMKVEFISRDANYYYVVRNGKYANIVVDKRIFDQDEGLRKTYKTLVDAMNKK
jgi:hypothetical protein